MKKLLSSTALLALIAGGTAHAEAPLNEPQTTAQANAMALKMLMIEGAANEMVATDQLATPADEKAETQNLWQAMSSLDWNSSTMEEQKRPTIKTAETMYQPGLIDDDMSSAQDVPERAGAFEDPVDPNGIDTMIQLLKVSNLYETLQEEEDITVFAPTNAAFKEIGETQLNRFKAGYDAEELSDVLEAHIVRDVVTPEGLESSSSEFDAMNEAQLTIRKDAVGQVRVENAFVVASDLSAENGAIHVVDQVISAEG